MSVPIGSVRKSPFFSIVLATFNRAHLVRRAIQSVLEQRCPDWELLIIDDGSRDGTFEHIRDLVLADERIRYHFATNRGLAVARNIGVTISTGDYVTFIDSDDTYDSEHLTLRAAYLKEHPEVDLLHGGVEVIGPDTVADKFDPTKQIPLSECTVGGTFVIRKSLVLELGGFRPVDYGDDNEFFGRAELSGAVIRKVQWPTYRYNRLEPDSLCAIVEREGIEGIQSFRKSTSHHQP